MCPPSTKSYNNMGSLYNDIYKKSIAAEIQNLCFIYIKTYLYAKQYMPRAFVVSSTFNSFFNIVFIAFFDILLYSNNSKTHGVEKWIF